MSKRTIIKGTLILTITGFLTRLLGFYNRIFLTRLIGVNALGLYQLIFPIYIFCYAVCGQGISLSLIKNVSAYAAKKDYNSCLRALKYSLFLSFLLSICCATILYIFSPFISHIILGDDNCKNLLRIISFAIPFVVIKSCFNSFFVGFEMPFLQGSSHLYEQIVRIVATYFLYLLASHTLFGASIAVIGLVIGEFVSMLYSFVYFMFKYKKIACTYNASKSTFIPYYERRFILKKLVIDLIPISINNISLSLFASIETILLPTMFLKYYCNSNTSLYVYGVISGIVMPFILFPATITNSLSAMLVPSVSSAQASCNPQKIKYVRNNTLYFCSALGILAWIFFYFFGDFAIQLTFHNLAAGKMLHSIGFICPLIYISNTLSSILTGIGKTYLNLIFNLISITIRIIMIIFYVPLYGPEAYICGIVISYTIQNILMIAASK